MIELTREQIRSRLPRSWLQSFAYDQQKRLFYATAIVTPSESRSEMHVAVIEYILVSNDATRLAGSIEYPTFFAGGEYEPTIKKILQLEFNERVQKNAEFKFNGKILRARFLKSGLMEVEFSGPFEGRVMYGLIPKNK